VVNQNTKKTQFRIPLQHTVTGKRINIRVLEPEQEELDPHFEMLKVARRCWEAISGDQTSKAATMRLDENRGHWVLLLFFVEHYCQHFRPQGKKEHNKFTKNIRKLKRKIAKFASSVRKWEAEIEKMNSEMEDALPIDAAAHSPDLPRYQAVLHVATVLALPSMMNATRKKDLIVLLYHLAKISTGKAHYEELADILQERLNAESEQELNPVPNQSVTNESTLDANTLKRTVTRFRREHPARYRKLEQTLRTLVEGAPFAHYELPPAVVKGQK